MMWKKNKIDDSTIKVCNVFIQMGIDSNDPIGHFRLQKLLYVAFGWHLVLFDSQLFKDRIVAWEHGPVIPSIYEEFKSYGSDPIMKIIRNQKFDPKNDGVKIKYLEQIWKLYRKHSTLSLSDYSRSESGPWGKIKKIRGSFEKSSIEDALFYEFFNNEKDRMGGNQIENYFIGNPI